MSPERRLAWRRTLDMFDLNRAGVVLTAATVAVLAGGALFALAMIF